MRVAVYCGSRIGNRAAFADKARELGTWFGSHGIDVVFGGGHVGLMGVVADAALDAGGRVFGVIPESLRDRELAHDRLTELYVVSDMHQRKAKMADLADAFLAMPGGIGTLEELFEAWTWGQLGFHDKPCGLYNIDGFYDPLLAMAATMQETGFVNQEYIDMIVRADTPDGIIEAFRNYTPPHSKWT